MKENIVSETGQCFTCKKSAPFRNQYNIYICSSCWGKKYEYIYWNDESLLLKWQRPVTFTHHSLSTILPLPISFGIECEIDFGKLDSVREFQYRLLKKIKTQSIFSAKSDGSLDCGLEFYSPVLQGERGIRHLEKFCSLAKFLPVKKSCGLHLHFDARHWSWKDCYKIYLSYGLVEFCLLSVLPLSRRKNSFCRCMPKQIFNMLPKASSQDDFQLLYWGSRCRIDRASVLRKKELLRCYKNNDYEHRTYHWDGINLENYWRNFRRKKTLEIRYHHGTTDFQKIYHWIVINMSIIKWATGFSISDLQKRANHPINFEFFVKEILSGWPLTQQFAQQRHEKFSS